MSTVPFIPDNAPFNPAQRAWLNGFLAGLYSSAPAQQAVSEAFEPRNVAVLYASQSGTGERLAKKVAKELKAKGHTAKLSSLDAYPVHELSVEEWRSHRREHLRRRRPAGRRQSLLRRAVRRNGTPTRTAGVHRSGARRQPL